MICQFAFKNFRSYKEEAVLDFQAANVPEFRESLITSEKYCDLLPLNVIYGPNGGGKTNVLKALGYLITLVTDPVRALGKNKENIIIQQSTHCVPFLLDNDKKNEPSEFRLFFRTDESEYKYYISVSDNIIAEELLARKKPGAKRSALIFERRENKVRLGNCIKNKSINTDVNEKMPYISFLAINYNIPVISDVRKFFEGCIIRNFGNPLTEQEKALCNDDRYKKDIITLMNGMDIDISDYRYDELNSDFLMQRIINGTAYELGIRDESEGIRKVFFVLPLLLLALREGRLIITDALDAKLHPKLLKYVISLFSSPETNRHKAQLLFTSQDMTTLNKAVFRRDEIWFAARNKDCGSELYSLYEMRNEKGERVKNTASYSKQYLEGRYGADPYLNNMFDEGDWNG